MPVPRAYAATTEHLLELMSLMRVGDLGVDLAADDEREAGQPL